MLNAALLVPPGLGDEIWVHLRPFQCRVWFSKPSVLPVNTPTAQQFDLELQATASRLLIAPLDRPAG